MIRHARIIISQGPNTPRDAGASRSRLLLVLKWENDVAPVYPLIGSDFHPLLFRDESLLTTPSSLLPNFCPIAGRRVPSLAQVHVRVVS